MRKQTNVMLGWHGAAVVSTVNRLIGDLSRVY